MNQKSNLYLPNRLVRITLVTLLDMMGENGLNAVFKRGNLEWLIHRLPPDDMQRQFDFADYAALAAAVEEIYGPRGAKVLLARAGRQAFANGISGFTERLGVAGLALKAIPFQLKMGRFLKNIAKTYSESSDRKCDLLEGNDHYLFINRTCPVCWGRTLSKPGCHITLGFLQEATHWISNGAEFEVRQVSSIACGDPSCDFKISKTPFP
jgi:predicted hydrocarbon binding protein